MSNKVTDDRSWRGWLFIFVVLYPANFVSILLTTKNDKKNGKRKKNEKKDWKSERSHEIETRIGLSSFFIYFSSPHRLMSRFSRIVQPVPTFSLNVIFFRQIFFGATELGKFLFSWRKIFYVFFLWNFEIKILFFGNKNEKLRDIFRKLKEFFEIFMERFEEKWRKYYIRFLLVVLLRPAKTSIHIAR